MSYHTVAGRCGAGTQGNRGFLSLRLLFLSQPTEPKHVWSGEDFCNLHSLYPAVRMVFASAAERKIQAVEGEAEGAEERPTTPSSLYSKNEAPAQMVLCVDTIGQVRSAVTSVHGLDDQSFRLLTQRDVGSHIRGRSNNYGWTQAVDVDDFPATCRGSRWCVWRAGPVLFLLPTKRGRTCLPLSHAHQQG